MQDLEVFLIKSMSRIERRPRAVRSHIKTTTFAHDDEMLPVIQGYKTLRKLGFSPQGPMQRMFEFWSKHMQLTNLGQALVRRLTNHQNIKIVFEHSEGDWLFMVQSSGSHENCTMLAYVANSTEILGFFEQKIELPIFWYSKILGWSNHILIGCWDYWPYQFELWAIDFNLICQSSRQKSPYMSIRYLFDSWVSPQLKLNGNDSQLIYITQEAISDEYYWPYSVQIVTLKPGEGFSTPITLKDSSRSIRQSLLCHSCPKLLLPGNKNRFVKIENIEKRPIFTLEISWMRFNRAKKSCRALHTVTLEDQFPPNTTADIFELPSKHQTVLLIDVKDGPAPTNNPRRIFFAAHNDRMHRLRIDGRLDQQFEVIPWRHLRFHSPDVIPNHWLGKPDQKSSEVSTVTHVYYHIN